VEDVGHGVARVAIVGAGYAGMAAAVTLAERGVRVTVLEAGPVPGGRARRVVTQGRALDNGQHIFVGAYSELFRLARAVGVPADAVLRMPLEIRYVNGFALRALASSRWGLAAGLLAARGVPFAERIGAVRFLRGMQAAKFRLDPDIAVSELLSRHSQDGRIGHYLWGPLCVSALNTPVTRASANVFLAALRDTLAGPAEASDLVLPRVDLSRLFPEPAAQFVGARGGELRLGTTARDVHALKKEFGKVIVAVGPHQLKTLLAQAPEFDYQPIYTCYLQYPEDTALGFPMLGMAQGLVQWVFDRGALLGEKGRLACVISAQGDHQQMSQDELAQTCHLELRRAFPQLPAPRWTQVIAEKRATIACTPGLKRPPQQTATPGVVLAGDYTDPEYPPTLEAAVRSGIRAADLVMSFN
jgi:hydroxysqualene dehydroxylase